MRKPVFGVSDKVQHKPECSSTENGWRKYRVCTIYVPKTKLLISRVVTTQLTCVFVFIYTKNRFSYDTHQIRVDSESQGLRWMVLLSCFNRLM